MKITIDTKEDSPEAIRKAIELLSHSLGEGEKQPYTNLFNDSEQPAQQASAEPTNAFSAMFSNDAPSLTQEPKPETIVLKDEPSEDEKEIAKRIQIIY